MNTSESDLINITFYPGWLMVSQLRCGQPVTDGEALYRQACRWVTEAREALTAGGVSEASAEQMLYAYCALLDESVLNRASQDDGYRRWRKDPLQARFFSTLNARKRKPTPAARPASRIRRLTPWRCGSDDRRRSGSG